MADLGPLANILKAMGYKLSNDPAQQLAEVKRATEELQRIAGEKVDWQLFPQQVSSIQKTLLAQVNDPQFATIKGAAAGKLTWDGITPQPVSSVKGYLIDKRGFTQTLVDNLQGVVNFMEAGAQGRHLKELATYIQASNTPAPVAAAPPPPGKLPPPPPGGPDPSANLKTYTASLARTLQVQPDQVPQALQNAIRGMQAQAAGKGAWSAPQDGVYNDALAKVIADNRLAPPTFNVQMKNWLSAGGQQLPPATASADQTRGEVVQQGGQGSSGQVRELSLAEASSNVEVFLNVAGRAISSRTSGPQGMLTGLILKVAPIPFPEEPDDDFNEDSQKSLQGVLKMFKGPLQLTDDEIYGITPAVIKKIKNNLPNLKKRLPEDQQDALSKENIDKLEKSLLVLHANHKLDRKELFTQSPLQLNETFAPMLKGLFGFLNKLLPGFMPFFDDMLKNFTGGFGFSDLMPDSYRTGDTPDAIATREALNDLKAKEGKYAGMSPKEKVATMYQEALEQVKHDPSKTPEQVQAQVEQAFNMMYGLPFGSKETREKYKQAFKEAMAEARAGTTAEAGKRFADAFNQRWDLEKHAHAAEGGGPVVEESVVRELTPTQKRVGNILQPQNSSRETVKLDPRAAQLADIDLIAKNYSDLNAGGGLQKALYFRNATNLVVAGVDNATNTFQVFQVTQKLQDDLSKALVESQRPGADQAALKAKLIADHPTFKFIESNYCSTLESYCRDFANPQTLKVAPTVAQPANVTGNRPAENTATNTTSDRGPERGDWDRPKSPPPTEAERSRTNGGLGELAMQRQIALGRPYLLKDSARHGQIEVLYVKRDAYDLVDAAHKTAAARSSSTNVWATVDVTREYAKMEREFDRFLDKHGGQLGYRPSKIDQANAFSKYMLDSGRDMRREYPLMSSIIMTEGASRANYSAPYSHGATPNVAYLFCELQKQAGIYAPGGSSNNYRGNGSDEIVNRTNRWHVANNPNPAEKIGGLFGMLGEAFNGAVHHRRHGDGGNKHKRDRDDNPPVVARTEPQRKVEEIKQAGGELTAPRCSDGPDHNPNGTRRANDCRMM